MRALTTGMVTTVASSLGHARKRVSRNANGGFSGCDFGDNKVGTDSYFDEADMSS
jgi:hypothetical protein